jgi:hypothetical protein
MQSTRGIGIKWAKEILEKGYQKDVVDPNKTYAFVWQPTTRKMQRIELSSESTFKFKSKWRGDMIK